MLLRMLVVCFFFLLCCFIEFDYLFIKMQLDDNYLMGRHREDGSRLLCKVHSNRQDITRGILFRYRNFTMVAVKYWERLPREHVETLCLEIFKIHLGELQSVQVSFEHLQTPVRMQLKAVPQLLSKLNYSMIL